MDPPPKRPRGGDPDLGRAAEIVLVLAAMGQLRAGRDPTEAERAMVEEVRGMVVRMCAEMRPNDLVSAEAARVVAGEMGLGRDVSGGRRKGTIAEKVAAKKRKMEEAKEFMPQPPQFQPSPISGSFATKPDNRSTVFHGTHRIFSDRPVGPGGVFPTGSPVAHTPMVGSSVKHSHFSATPLKSPAPASPAERASSIPAATPNEAGHFRMDARPSPPPHLAHTQAPSIGNHVLDKTSSISRSTSTPATMVRPNHVSNNSQTKVDVVNAAKPFNSFSQVLKDKGCKVSVVPSPQGNMNIIQQPNHGVNFVQVPTSNIIHSHSEIAKFVQNFLQPNVADVPSWTPPSLDYANKPLNCMVCKICITDFDSLLVCDTCEKGVHLKCLKSFNQKAASNVEWHCPKCIHTSNGKPLPPKYGKVTRNISSAPKASNSGGSNAPPERKNEIGDKKVIHENKMVNANPSSTNPSQTCTITGSNSQSILDEPLLNTGHVQNNKGDKENVTVKEMARLAGASSNPPSFGSRHSIINNEASSGNTNKPNPETSLNSEVQSSKIPDEPTASVTGVCCQSENQITTRAENAADFASAGGETKEPSESVQVANKVADTSLGNSVIQRDEERDGNCPQSSNPRIVEWVGDALDIVDGKTYYQSCCVDGLVYNLQDVVLLSSDSHGFSPSKLQVMWQDNMNGSKWAIVNRFYFPTDLDEAIVKPSTPENDEVYESNDSCTIEAGLICGPCAALPSMKFKEESGKRAGLKVGNNLCPIYLCRWFYDKYQTLFQPITG